MASSAPDPWHQLAEGIDALGIQVGAAFEAGARAYLDELERWSRVTRLAGHRSHAERVRELILGSLTFLVVIPEPAAPLLDIGSGAGIPGLILKLARPTWPVTLLEANRRRVHFLQHVGRRLALAGLDVREGRAEALAREPGLAAAFQTVTMRAVAGLAEARRLARPFVAPTGHAVIAAPPDVGDGPAGTVRRVAVARESLGLRMQRSFFIIPGSGNDAGRRPAGGRFT